MDIFPCNPFKHSESWHFGQNGLFGFKCTGNTEHFLRKTRGETSPENTVVLLHQLAGVSEDLQRLHRCSTVSLFFVI